MTAGSEKRATVRAMLVPPRLDARALAVSLVAALFLAPVLLAAASTLGNGVFMATLAAIALAFACAIGLLVLGARRRPAAQGASRSATPAELRLVASRLVSVEKQVAALSDGSSSAHPALAANTADLGLLSGLVKSLAEALVEQERDFTELRDRVEALSRQLEHAAPTAGSAGGGLRSARTPSRPWPDEPAEPVRAEARIPPRLFPEAAASGPRAGGPAIEAARMRPILEAAEAGRIEFHLQPIVSLPQRHIRAYELLSRLRLADETLLPPGAFLEALTAAGATARFDERVISRAIGIAAELEPASREIRLHCNLAPPSLEDARFLSRLEQIAAATPAGARRLVLEIQAESWLTLSSRQAPVVERLRAAGILFAVDGFATAAAAELDAWPPDLAKLSAALLLGMPHPDAVSLVERLARHGVRTVAARVESERDIPDLIDLDLVLAQGSALGRPRPMASDTIPVGPTYAPGTSQAPAPSHALGSSDIAPPEAGAAASTPPNPQPAPIPAATALPRLPEIPQRLRDVLRRAG